MVHVHVTCSVVRKDKCMMRDMNRKQTKYTLTSAHRVTEYSLYLYPFVSSTNTIASVYCSASRRGRLAIVLQRPDPLRFLLEAAARKEQFQTTARPGLTRATCKGIPALIGGRFILSQSFGLYRLVYVRLPEGEEKERRRRREVRELCVSFTFVYCSFQNTVSKRRPLRVFWTVGL